jgi:hypothetical protein
MWMGVFWPRFKQREDNPVSDVLLGIPPKYPVNEPAGLAEDDARKDSEAII